MCDHADDLGVAAEDGADLLHDLGRGRLPDEQARHLDRQHDRDRDEQHADREAAGRFSPARLVEEAPAKYADQRERESDEAPMSSSTTTASSGIFVRRTNW